MSFSVSIDSSNQSKQHRKIEWAGNDINSLFKSLCILRVKFKNMLSIKEQEDFMHLIFDCIHIGVSLESLEWSLKSMKEKFGNELPNILNTVMKNEKYSNNFIYPLEKVIKVSSSHLLCDDFFKINLDAIKILLNYSFKDLNLN